MVSPGFTQRRGKALAALLALAAVLLGGWVDLLKAQSNYATPYTFSTLAGYDVNEGAPPGAFSNGTGPAAQFNQPFGITVDSSGNLYVADTINCLIRKITSEGVVTTFAGAPGVQGSSDSTDGTGSTARFENPHGIAVDASGNLYVADTYNCTIRKITSAGDVTTLAGSPGVAGSSDSTDGTGSTARFNYPFGIAVDTNGNLYVADTYNCTIRKITPSGDVTTLAGSPRVHGSSDSTDGTGSTARFNLPYGIAVDTSGNVYIADSNNFTIRKITPAGNVTTLAGSPGVSGSTDGTGSAALFGDEQNDGPCGVTVDVGGNLYVADTDNATLRKITQEGIVTTLAGNAGYRGGTDGAGSGAFLIFLLASR